MFRLLTITAFFSSPAFVGLLLAFLENSLIEYQLKEKRALPVAPFLLFTLNADESEKEEPCALATQTNQTVLW